VNHNFYWFVIQHPISGRVFECPTKLDHFIQSKCFLLCWNGLG
jgi:hypothetical protein